ncbi:hypothetical protein HKX48_003070 [Thoreauomyces humboldtii]|nr:hypothetical protein HKX48_003070 [Thoreauomyces humboldtii]
MTEKAPSSETLAVPESIAGAQPGSAISDKDTPTKDASTGKFAMEPSDVETSQPDGRAPGQHAKGVVRVPLRPLPFFLVFVSLCLSLFLAALDQTIVSTAVPKISAQFQAFDQSAWIGIGYLLTATALSPTWGKLADIFGRKASFIAAIVIFEIGSAVCGAAQNMPMLVIGRAIAGAGGGGLFSLILIIISDLVTFEDRGKYQGILGGVFGIASVVGPLLGGVFTDAGSGGWRWCFFINLPLGAIAVGVILLVLHMPDTTGSLKEKLGRIDYLGTFFLLATIIFLLVPLEFGGTKWAWTEAKTIVLFVLGAVSLIAFIFVELRVAKEPIIPAALFESASVTCIIILSFFIGASFFALVYYVSDYFQVVNNSSATQAGISSIPLILAVSLLSIFAGQVISRAGVYVPFFWIGGILLTIGSGLMTTLSSTSNNGEKIGYLIIAGAGVGCLVQTKVIGVQASVDIKRIAIATAVTNFAQTLGGTFGVAIVGTVFNNELRKQLEIDSPGGPSFDDVQRNIGEIKTQYPDSAAQVEQALTKTLQTVFIVTTVFAGMIVVLAAGIRQKRFRGGPKPAPVAAE